MSAYVEPKAHIDALVTLAVDGPRDRVVGPWNPWSAHYTVTTADGRRIRHDVSNLPRDGRAMLGQMLWDENVRSVNYRYNEDEPAEPYTYEPGRRLTAVEGLVALAGYEYQSCEHPGWETSEAKAAVDGLRWSLIPHLPGYTEADTWSIAA